MCRAAIAGSHLETISTEDLGTRPLRAPRQQSIHLSSTSRTSCNFSPSLNDKCPLSADSRCDSVLTWRTGSLQDVVLWGKLPGRVDFGADAGGFLVLKIREKKWFNYYITIVLCICVTTGSSKKFTMWKISWGTLLAQIGGWPPKCLPSPSHSKVSA